MNRFVREAAIDKGIRSVVICPSMIYGRGRGLQPDSDQLPKIIALSKQLGAGVYFGKGLNRYSNVHIDDLVELYLLALEKAPGGSFFFAENGDASFKEIAEMISRSLGLGGKTVSLNVEDLVRQYGDAGRYGITSNSLVSAVNARRLGWSPKGPSLAEYFESRHVSGVLEVTELIENIECKRKIKKKENIMAYQSINPFNGELLQRFDQQTDAQMESALAKADSTFQNVWSKATFRDRAKVVGRAASLMLERKESLARLAAIEMGKRISEGRDEVEMSAAILQYFADHAEAFLAPQAIDTAMGDAHLEFSPLGVLIGVQPWNFPYYQLARFAAPNLMAGNVLLVKHSSSVPQCALAFQQLFTDAGAPRGAYTNLFVSSDQVGALLDDPRTKGVALTGSEQAGESLASRAGKNLKRSTMELGGSDAFIVLEDCDLEFAVKMAVLGRIGNVGQTCIGAKRFIVVGPQGRTVPACVS